MTCDVIAEAGINHNGSPERALAMLKSATEAGCAGFKVQCYTAEEFVGPNETYTYLERDGKGGFRRVTEKQRDMFNRCALSWEAVLAVHAECARTKVKFVATATDAEWVARLRTLEPHPILKVGSDDIIHLPLLRAVAASGLPVFLSTGMASEAEITRAVAIVRPAALLHCVSLYPTPYPKANLSRMLALADQHDVPVGFSDHTEGALAGMLAAAMGARVIEKHFTLDKALPGPDHWFSADPTEMRQLTQGVKTAAIVCGSGKVEPDDAEREMRAVARRSVLAACEIPSGVILRQDMVTYRRPGTGLAPGTESRLLGRAAARKIEEGEVLSDSMFLSEVAN